MTTRDRRFRETCGWPGCIRRVSWKQPFCRPHWLAIPEGERMERGREVFAARKAADGTGTDGRRTD